MNEPTIDELREQARELAESLHSQWDATAVQTMLESMAQNERRVREIQAEVQQLLSRQLHEVEDQLAESRRRKKLSLRQYIGLLLK